MRSRRLAWSTVTDPVNTCRSLGQFQFRVSYQVQRGNQRAGSVATPLLFAATSCPPACYTTRMMRLPFFKNQPNSYAVLQVCKSNELPTATGRHSEKRTRQNLRDACFVSYLSSRAKPLAAGGCRQLARGARLQAHPLQARHRHHLSHHAQRHALRQALLPFWGVDCSEPLIGSGRTEKDAMTETRQVKGVFLM